MEECTLNKINDDYYWVWANGFAILNRTSDISTLYNRFNEHAIKQHNNMKPQLDKVIYQFTQDGNTMGSTDDVEELTIECESSTGNLDSDDQFYVIRTSTGWSIDNAQELVDLIYRVISTFKKQ